MIIDMELKNIALLLTGIYLMSSGGSEIFAGSSLGENNKSSSFSSRKIKSKNEAKIDKEVTSIIPTRPIDKEVKSIILIKPINDIKRKRKQGNKMISFAGIGLLATGILFTLYRRLGNAGQESLSVPGQLVAVNEKKAEIVVKFREKRLYFAASDLSIVNFLESIKLHWGLASCDLFLPDKPKPLDIKKGKSLKELFGENGNKQVEINVENAKQIDLNSFNQKGFDVANHSYNPVAFATAVNSGFEKKCGFKFGYVFFQEFSDVRVLTPFEKKFFKAKKIGREANTEEGKANSYYARLEKLYPIRMVECFVENRKTKEAKTRSIPEYIFMPRSEKCVSYNYSLLDPDIKLKLEIFIEFLEKNKTLCELMKDSFCRIEYPEHVDGKKLDAAEPWDCSKQVTGILEGIYAQVNQYFNPNANTKDLNSIVKETLKDFKLNSLILSVQEIVEKNIPLEVQNDANLTIKNVFGKSAGATSLSPDEVPIGHVYGDWYEYVAGSSRMAKHKKDVMYLANVSEIIAGQMQKQCLFSLFKSKIKEIPELQKELMDVLENVPIDLHSLSRLIGIVSKGTSEKDKKEGISDFDTGVYKGILALRVLNLNRSLEDRSKDFLEKVEEEKKTKIEFQTLRKWINGEIKLSIKQVFEVANSLDSMHENFNLIPEIGNGLWNIIHCEEVKYDNSKPDTTHLAFVALPIYLYQNGIITLP
jgi:hypothetical protein